MKSILKIVVGILSIVFISGAMASVGVPVQVTAPVLVVGSLAYSYAQSHMAPEVRLYGVLVELWTGELIEKFRHAGQWLSEIPSEDKYVNNNAIHLVDVGADPAVLIDNTTYPIAVATRTDADVVVALKKFDTENTAITDDELYALPYDKPGSVMRQHLDVLEETTMMYGLHSLAPSADSTNTPVVKTTGANNGTRKRMKVADIATIKKRLDDLKVPLTGRVLVLCNAHLNDLILDQDQSFRDRFYNTATGQVMDFYGFKIYQSTYNPVYNASFNKVAFSAAPAGTDHNASIVFYAPRAFKARGSVKFYYQDASINPTLRQSVAGYRLYHIVLQKKNIGFGAIVSDDAV
jgi:hypothetical protein